MHGWKNRFTWCKLSHFIELDEKTGRLYWRERDPQFFKSDDDANAWNRTHAGCEVTGNFVKIFNERISRERAITVMCAPKVTVTDTTKLWLIGEGYDASDDMIAALVVIMNAGPIREQGDQLQLILDMIPKPGGRPRTSVDGKSLASAIAGHILPWVGRRAGESANARYDWNALQKVGDSIEVPVEDACRSFRVLAYNHAAKHGFKVSVRKNKTIWQVTRL